MNKGFGEDQRVTILLAEHRSGTTLLREDLKQSSQLHVLDEVFVEYRDVPQNYFHFLVQKVAKVPLLAVPSIDNRRHLFNDYVAHLQSLHGRGASLLLDVKYSHAHALNKINHRPLDSPLFLNLCKEHGFRFIHLQRKNLLQTLVSLRVAIKNDSFRTRERRQVADPTIAIDSRSIVEELQKREQEVRLFRDWLDGYPHVLDITYEEMTSAATGLRPNVLEMVLEFLELPPRQPAVPRREKLGLPMDQVIENYDEICDALAGTRYEWMVNG